MENCSVSKIKQGKVLVAQSCLTLCDPMDCSLPGSSIHGSSQARILEWIAISFSGIFQTQGLNSDLLHLQVLAGSFFTTEPPEKPMVSRSIQKCLFNQTIYDFISPAFQVPFPSLMPPCTYFSLHILLYL